MTTNFEKAPQPAGREPTTVTATDLEHHPHLVFRCLRPLTAVIKRADGIYVAIRAPDVERLATDPRTRQAETEIALSRGVAEGPLFDLFKNTMLLSNGTEHRRRRAPLSRAFAFKLIEDLRPRIRNIANELIDRRYARHGMDLVADYAAWIPAYVISEILGLPDGDIPEFTRDVYSLTRAFGSSFTREDVPELQAAAYKLTRYVDDLLQRRHVEPRNDLLKSYMNGIEDSGTLSPSETLAQLVTVILGGSDTTRAAMAIQTSLLLEHRDQWNAVCSDATLIPGAVLESLRYEPSVASFARVTLEDIELDGWTVPRQRVLSLSTMSAMRDPALYADPDRFDITRTDHPRRHMVFGAGAHRCLGEVLARVELEEGLAALATRLPKLQLVSNPIIVQGSGGVRTVKDTRVWWSGALSE